MLRTLQQTASSRSNYLVQHQRRVFGLIAQLIHEHSRIGTDVHFHGVVHQTERHSNDRRRTTVHRLGRNRPVSTYVASIQRDNSSVKTNCHVFAILGHCQCGRFLQWQLDRSHARKVTIRGRLREVVNLENGNESMVFGLKQIIEIIIYRVKT